MYYRVGEWWGGEEPRTFAHRLPTIEILAEIN
jgi:hypothetical protein